MMGNLDKFCKKSGMDVNEKKTEIMVFRKGEMWCYRGEKIEVINE